jgi:Fe-S oxidoreductase
MTESVAPLKEAVELITEQGGETVQLCHQCGLCDTVCPWNYVTNFMVRKLVRQAQLGVSEMGPEIWQCTTCGNCIDRCPRGVEIIDVILALRRISSTHNPAPRNIGATRGSLMAEGNPWGGNRNERSDFAKALDVKTFSENTDILYFPCCTQIYDLRTRKTAIATVDILKKAGVDFGILGSRQVCCGESIRKTGDEELFKRLARDNIRLFIEKGVKRVLVSSPHCYHAFKNEYPEFKINLDVIHISEFIADLIYSGELRFNGNFNARVTYHDPCYLGRHNNLYDQPRKILNMIPGLERVELDDPMIGSFCCGGGGARIWLETRKVERLADLRLKQAMETGAEVLATSCPYCIMNFEDSKKAFFENNLREIKDVTEIVSEVV